MIIYSENDSCTTKTSFCSQRKRVVFLNQDLLTDILSRLPVKSLLRFQSVNKTWCSIIQDPTFTALHVSKSIVNNNGNLLVIRKQGIIKHITRRKVISLLSHETHNVFSNMVVPFQHCDKFLKMVGSCNGVLCLTYSLMTSNFIYLFNPATREVKKLPEPFEVPEGCDHEDVELGFGYGPKTNDYKIVRIHRYFQDSKTLKVYSKPDLYSLNNDSWKQLGNIDGVIVGNACKESLNGILHWKAIKVLEKAGEGEMRTYKFIMSFDLEKEVFKVIMLPDYCNRLRDSDWRAYSVSLFISKQSLSMVVRSSDGMSLDVWVMQKYGVTESWIKHSTIQSYEFIRRVVGFGKNNEILYVNHDSKLVLYDPSIRGTKVLSIHGLSRWSWRVEVFNYTESPVMIKGRKLQVKRDISRFMFLFFSCFLCTIFLLLLSY